MNVIRGGRDVLGVAGSAGTGVLGQLVGAMVAAAGRLGISARVVRDADDEARVERLVLIGFPALAPWLMTSRPRSRRILWLTEPLARPTGSRLARLVRQATPPVRALDAAYPLAQLVGLGRPAGRWRERTAITREGLRTLASVRKARPHFDEIVATIHQRRASLAEAGIPSRVVEIGYHARWAGPLVPAESARDIAVVFLGKVHRRSRRERIVPELKARLDPAVRLTDGLQLDGEARDSLLARTSIVLDIPRIPGNFAGTRMVLAAAAGALYVSEPLDDSGSWTNGRDYLEAPLERLPQVISDALAEEERRRQLVVSAQQLLRERLSLERSIEQLLPDVTAGRAPGSAG